MVLVLVLVGDAAHVCSRGFRTCPAFYWTLAARGDVWSTWKAQVLFPLGHEYVFREWKRTDCFLFMALKETEPSTFSRGTDALIHPQQVTVTHLHTHASWQFWFFKDLKPDLSEDPPTYPSVRPSMSQPMQIWGESLILGLDAVIRDHITTVWWNSHEITVHERLEERQK